MPTMNPDGFEIATVGDAQGYRGRSNARGQDLNRDFPDQFDKTIAQRPRQPETKVAFNQYLLEFLKKLVNEDNNSDCCDKVIRISR